MRNAQPVSLLSRKQAKTGKAMESKQSTIKLEAGTKPSEEEEDDPLEPEIAWHEKYNKDFGIPRGVGYYHVQHGRQFVRSHSAYSGFDGTSRPRPLEWAWQPEYTRETWKATKSDEDTIPEGIGYYSDDKRWVKPRSKAIDHDKAETKEEGDVIPKGLGFYRATSGPEYTEDHLRDPTYYYQAHRLAYPALPDAGNKAQFVPDDERI
eukprot:CAMPEP_0196720496 /NCGR_PEP_ID=MMETSP1091-20130531/3289_1 /TAXON_ID=302021 /ORGANISM="Rhodomonas sp., Strain CCMP768" /LENGTH=206 /DNA_ID=CAMNT_0042061761 /DNA_START=85 /DNA_END=705 /DNA_ORIENTATION=-